MPLLLPPELLVQILELATSPLEAVSARKDDQQLLFTCCLVSKQICAIAQPMLWRVFSTTSRDFSALIDFPHLASHVHVLVRPPISLLGAVVAPLQNLREVRIITAASVWPSELVPLQHLQSLVLSNVCLPDVRSLVFSNLATLTLANVRPHPEGFRLSGSSFPALKAFHTSSWHLMEPNGELVPIEPTNLSPGQLDVYQVPFYLVDKSSPDLHKHKTPLLLTIDIGGASTLSHSAFDKVEHLQLDTMPAADQCVDGDYFQSILNLVKRSKTFKSLSLPITVSPTLLASLSSGSLRDKLLQVCVESQIDVIWRQHSKKPEDDIAVSRDFWEYAKELKRKKQLEVEGSS